MIAALALALAAWAAAASEIPCPKRFDRVEPDRGPIGTVFKMHGRWGPFHERNRPSINRGNSHPLPIVSWSDAFLEARVPDGLGPGVYKVGVYCRFEGGNYANGWKDFEVTPGPADEPADLRRAAESLRREANDKWAADDPGGCVESAEAAAKAFAALDDPAGRAYVLHIRGYCLEGLGRYADAYATRRDSDALYREAQGRAGGSPELARRIDLERANLLYSLGASQLRAGELDAAERTAAERLALYARHGEASGLAVGHSQVAEVAERRGRWVTAADHYQQAAAAYEKAGNAKGVESMLRSFRGAIEARDAAPAAAPAAPGPAAVQLERSDAEGSLKEVYAEMCRRSLDRGLKPRKGEPAAGLEQLSFSVDACRRAGDPTGEATALDRRAMLHDGAGRLEAGFQDHLEAVRVARRAFEAAPPKELDAKRTALAYQLFRLVAASAKKGDDAEELAAAREIVELREAQGLPGYRQVAQYNLGMVHERAGRLSEALKAYEAAAAFRNLSAPHVDKARQRVADRIAGTLVLESTTTAVAQLELPDGAPAGTVSVPDPEAALARVRFAITVYEAENVGRAPASLDELVRKGHLDVVPEGVLYDPATGAVRLKE